MCRVWGVGCGVWGVGKWGSGEVGRIKLPIARVPILICSIYSTDLVLIPFFEKVNTMGGKRVKRVR